jgi:hypothetical protein
MKNRPWPTDLSDPYYTIELSLLVLDAFFRLQSTPELLPPTYLLENVTAKALEALEEIHSSQTVPSPAVHDNTVETGT